MQKKAFLGIFARSTKIKIFKSLGFMIFASMVFSVCGSSPTFASTHSLSMSTSGTVSVDVSTTGNGTAVGQDNLTIISTCPNGYTVTIKGPNDTNLYKDGNTANNATNTKITPSAGTISNPLPITDNTSNGGANYRGTWGYSLTSSTGTGNFIGLTSTTTTLFTKNTASGDGNIAPNGTSTGTTDTIPIYYGVSTTLDQAPGLYTMSSTNNSNGAITYFITTPESCTSYTVAYNPTSTANSTTLTGTGTMPNQTISEDTATNLNTNTFTAPTGYSFNGWNTKQDGTGTHYANNASVTNLIPAGQTITLYAEWSPNSYTCTKRYRLQNADGTFPDTYTSDTTEQVPYNTTCTYTKSVTNYKGTSDGANNSAGSTDHKMDSTNGITLSLDLYRNTYNLIIDEELNTSAFSVKANSTSGTSIACSLGYYSAGIRYTCSNLIYGANYYLYPTYNTGYEFNSYQKTDSATGSYLSSTSNVNAYYTVGAGNGAIKMTGKRSTYNLVITADSYTTAFSVRAGSTSGTSTSCSKSSNTFTCSSLTYGTSYYLYPTFASGYEFNSYQKTDSATNAQLGSTSSVNTYYKMGAGNGAITMTSKMSIIAFQNATSADCGKFMYDNRGTDTYKSIIYTTATINGLCWMTRNLDLPGGTTLTSSDSNVASDYTLPASSTSGFTSDSTAYVYNSNSTTCGNGQPCYSYYSYKAATAGTNPSGGAAISDICPKGWRLPTLAEYITLRNTYTTGATLTAAPFYGVYAGYRGDGWLSTGGSNGYYWSSTADGSDAVVLVFYSGGGPLNDGSTNTNFVEKRDGYSVRCVAKS